ncbi:MAG: TIM barrel protein [Candidatus Pacebacteria bacterium]|nr:TIM barrel protein [Candidatus Paceibacterota bacterium]
MRADVLLDVFFAERSIDERIATIAEAGWAGVETWKGGDAKELKAMGDACRERNMELVSIVMNGPADPAMAPVNRDNLSAFLDRIDRYSDNALAAGCTSGIVTTGNRLTIDYYEQKQTLIEALRQATQIAEKKNFLLNLEPLNDKVDHAGYFLVSREEAVDVARQVNSPHLRVLYDLYHQQIMTGDHLAFLAANMEWIGHFHSAGVPGRHEIFTGEMDYSFVVRRIRELGYKGWFGLEYMPALDPTESLRQTAELLASALADQF